MFCAKVEQIQLWYCNDCYLTFESKYFISHFRGFWNVVNEDETCRFAVVSKLDKKVS